MNKKYQIIFLAVICFSFFTSEIFSQVNLSLPVISRDINSGEEYISITVSEVTNLNITSYQFDLFYDSEIISLSQASPSGTISSYGFFSSSADTINGWLRVGWASDVPLSGSGNLVRLKIRYKKEGYSLLTFTDNQNISTFEFNNGIPTVFISEGSVTVGSSQTQLMLIRPDGGEILYVGSNDSITWSSNYIDYLKIELSSDDGTTWEVLEENFPALHKAFFFSVPNVLSQMMRIKICDAGNPLVNDISNSPFTIMEKPVGVDNDFSNLPTEFILHQNFPNPFNPGTTIKYSVPAASYITIKLYNILGGELKTLLEENKAAGNYSLNISLAEFESGIFFCRMQAENFSSTKKITLLK